MALTERRQRFVEEYLIDLNGSAAYRRAGYKPKDEESARKAASRLLTFVDVQAAIAAGRNKQITLAQATAADVVEEWSLLGKSDIGDILDFSGDVPRMRPANQIPARARRLISSVKVRREVVKGSDPPKEVEIIEFKLWSKPDALEKLGRVHGLLKDAVEVRGAVELVFVNDFYPRSVKAVPPSVEAALPAAASGPRPDASGQDEGSGVRAALGQNGAGADRHG